jgi:N-methylhydantoinase A
MNGLVLGIDVGGTFTDVIALDRATGEVRAAKAPTRPDRLVEGIADGLRAAEVDLARASLIVHGSTTCTNALLEGKQARTGFIGTKGFTDEFDIQRMVRRWSETPWSAIYDLQQEKPSPFIPRSLRRTVRERVGPSGEVLEPLETADVAAGADALREEGVEAVALCFLWSPLNPDHELAARQIVEQRCPGVPVCASVEVAPVVREYERMVTTAINASLLPLFGAYLAEVEDELRRSGFKGTLFLMQSSGSVASPASLAGRPIVTLNSGPVGGAVAAAALARRLGREAAIACDIGGTSTDTTVLLDFQVPSRDDVEVAYYPVKLPTADIRSIGAGGGSVAALDAAGALHVGPESMGSTPGPACYGRGGTLPTVTDAQVVLGRIGPETLARGGVRISPQLARDALAPLAAALQLDVAAAAHAVVTVAVANIAHALRLQTVDRGLDPRDFALIAFGGAGGLHATLVADAASMPEVVIPPAPGVFSARGMLTSDHGTSLQSAFLAPADEVTDEELEAAFCRLEKNALATLGEVGAQASIDRAAAMRYVLQEWELPVRVPADLPEAGGVDGAVAAFHAAHEARYGFARPEMPVEFVTLLVSAASPAELEPKRTSTPRVSAAEPIFRAVHVDADHGTIDVAVHQRQALVEGDVVSGPCLVEEPTATAYIQPGWRASVDDLGDIVARRTG